MNTDVLWGMTCMNWATALFLTTHWVEISASQQFITGCLCLLTSYGIKHYKEHYR